MNLSGHWRGHYGRGGADVTFDATLIDHWYGRLTGEIFDDPMAGVPGKASLTGWCLGARLSFTKRYRTAYASSASGLIPLSQHLEEKHGKRFDAVPDGGVEYTGTRSRNQADTLRGSWLIPAGVAIASDGTRIALPAARGYWEMTRVHLHTSMRTFAVP